MKFFDLEDEFYREFPYRIQVILTGDLNYSDPVTQQEIEKVMHALESTSYVTSSLYTESWLRTFLDFLDRNQEFLNITINSEQDFIDAMRTVTVSKMNFDQPTSTNSFVISELAVPGASLLIRRKVQQKCNSYRSITIPNPSSQHNGYQS